MSFATGRTARAATAHRSSFHAILLCPWELGNSKAGTPTPIHAKTIAAAPCDKPACAAYPPRS